MAAIPSLGAVAAALAGGGTSTQATLNLQRPYPLPGMRTERRGRRRLQTADDECEGDFGVNSLLWTDSAGCYTDAGNSIYEYTVGEKTYVVGAIPMYNSADSSHVWVAGEVTAVSASSAATLDPHCHSEGDTTVHAHPADVESWLCDIDNTGTAYTEMTPAQFSTECGCAVAGEEEAPATTAPVDPTTPAPAAATRDLGTPAPAAAEAPTPGAAVTGTLTPVMAEAPTAAAVTATAAPVMVAAPTPAPVMVAAPTPAAAVTETLAPGIPAIGGDDEEEEEEEEAQITSTSVTSDTPNGLCGEIQPLTVVTSLPLLVDLEGCYEETGHEYHEEGGHFFSITGSHLRGQMAIFPGYVDAESTDARWFLGFLALSAEDTLVYCVSAQPPSAGHPSTADWYCDNGAGQFPLLSHNEFNVLCGCGTESSSTTDSETDATESPSHDSATSHESATSSSSPRDMATHSPAHEATTPPTTGGATVSPALGATTPPAVGGATEHPSHGHTTTPTPTAGVGLPTLTPAPGLELIVGGSRAPIAVASAAPVAGHTTSADEHGSGHTTSASDEDHNNSGTHSGTPSPTTIARGIIAASETPAPSTQGMSASVSNAASRTTTAVFAFSGVSCLCAVAAGVAGLFTGEVV